MNYAIHYQIQLYRQYIQIKFQIYPLAQWIINQL
jgi:hypothetical protein